VLNTPVHRPRHLIGRHGYGGSATFAYKLLAAILVLAIMGANFPASNAVAPRPIAPQQLIEPANGVFTHTFSDGGSVYRWAKCVICRYRAMVPAYNDVNEYVKEVVDVHNKTRMPDEPKIINPDNITTRTMITFYPPSHIVNPREKQLQPVYNFFMSIVKDSCSYITGDWCERGMGGGSPHYGMDVAAKLGSPIISPVDGIAILHDSQSAGRMLGVVREGTVIFFAHMNERFLKSGELVKKGQAVGTVGLTGQTSGPHVHVGYGIKSLSGDGINFGRSYYKLTDPKLFFYREAYLENLKNN
jgi:hypothetical protein